MADYSEFTDVPIRTSEDFRMVCDRARRACNELADALLFAARVSKTQMIKFEKNQAKLAARRAKSGGKKFVMPTIFTWRARAVARVFIRASVWARSAGKCCDKAYQVFLKHYAEDMAAKQQATAAAARRSA